MFIEKPSSLFFFIYESIHSSFLFFFYKNTQKHKEKHREGDTFAAQSIPGDRPEWQREGGERERNLCTNTENLHTEKHEPVYF